MGVDAIADLFELLEEERVMLLCGNIAGVNDAVTRKAKLLERMDKGSVRPSDLNDLRLKAARNQALLEASLAGIRAARVRLAEIRLAASQFDTYTDSGTVRNLIGPRRRFERRA